MSDRIPASPFADAQLAPQAAFLNAALGRIQANLEMLVGAKLTIAAGEPCMTPGATFKEALPETGMVLGVRAGGAIDAPLYCVLSQPLVVALASLVQLKSEGALRDRLAAPLELNESEAASAREIGSFIVAALGDFAKESTGGRIVLTPAEPRFLPGEGPDLFAADEACAILEAAAGVGALANSTLVLAAPLSMAEAWSAPPPRTAFGSHAGGSSGGRVRVPEPGALWVAGSEETQAAVRGAVADDTNVTAFPTLAELIAALDSAAPATVVIEVAAGSEFQLELISALRRHPSLGSSQIIVALASPTRRHVVRCGSLGLLNVIPVGLEAPVLKSRLCANVQA